MDVRLAVLIPSRGLIHSRTIEDILTNLRGRQARIFITHDEDIPDAFNTLVDRAMETDATHFFFVEEDMKLPKDVLNRMLMVDAEVVTINYPAGNGEPTFKQHGTTDGIIQTGTGCLLVHRRVFEEVINTPYFRTSIIYQAGTFDPMPAHPHIYGLHDIDFSVRCHDNDILIKAVPMTTAGQYRVESMGLSDTNSGAHKITELTL